MSGVTGLTDGARLRQGNAPVASLWFQYLLAASAVLGITLLLFFLKPAIGYRSLALIYLLAEVVLALFVGRGPTLLAGALSALAWDFCFVGPVGTLRISNVEDSVLFGTYFVVALVLGQLIARIRAQEEASRRREEQATALYELTRDLDASTTLSQLLEQVAQHIERAFEARAAVFLPDVSGQLSLHPHPAGAFAITGADQPAADWTFRQGRPAGKFAEHLAEAETHFVPLLAGGRVMGVLGLRFSQALAPTLPHRSLLEAFAQPIALFLDRQLREESGQRKPLTESERFTGALLNSVSREIHAPLAAMKSAVNRAGSNAPPASPTQQAMAAEIQETVERLDGVVAELMDLAQFEAGRVRPKLSPCDVSKLVHLALKETKKQLARHAVSVEIGPGWPLVQADFALLQRSLMNLLSNAAVHTPPGTAIQVRGIGEDGTLTLSVGDNGPGIPPEALGRVFDKFYRAPGASTGGTGLGLFLVKGFVEAQGGQVSVENRLEGGALFTIRLPLGQAQPNPAP